MLKSFKSITEDELRNGNLIPMGPRPRQPDSLRHDNTIKMGPRPRPAGDQLKKYLEKRNKKIK
jgi:hypothetical protein